MNKDQQLIAQIKRGNKEALDRLYKRYQREFKLFAKRFSASDEDVKDVYQDSVIAFYENVCNGKLTELNGSLKTYLFAIGKYKFYNLNMNNTKMTYTEDSMVEYGEETDLFAFEVTEERQELLRRGFRELGSRCQEVLRLFYYEGKTLDDIQTELNYTSKDVLKSQKSRCIKHLKELISKDE